ncbi:MAG: TetR/AcrR family transcriptional regulator [Actinobacteria bacterium]|nr:TetR/AcrR family transcriptional regulator [Actinomycetota bacterium]
MATEAATEEPAVSRREQRRQQQLALSKTQLLDAAEEIFGAKGLHATTLKEIAERAEFSVGTVYSFFENKDDLFVSVLLRRGEEMVPGMRSVVEGAGTATERMHALVDYEVEFFREHRHFGRLYLRTSSINQPAPDLAPADQIAENFRAAMQIQADLFASGQKSGELRAGDPVVLARLFSGLVSAYQSTDPAVMSDGNGGTERLPLGELHAIIEAAFRRG